MAYKTITASVASEAEDIFRPQQKTDEQNRHEAC